MKPVLLIGLDPEASRESMKAMREQFEKQLPEYRIVIVSGMQYATVLEGEPKQ